MNQVQVVHQVQSGYYPEDWRVFRGNKGTYGGCATAAGVIALVGAVLALAQLASANLAFFFILMIGCFICVVAMPICRNIAKEREKSLFIIMPEGAVVCYNGNLNTIRWLSFLNIVRLELMAQTKIEGYEGSITSSTSYWLDVYSRNGTYFSWSIKD